MKLVVCILSSAILGWAALRPDGGTVELIVAGNLKGNLAPCGCSKPMIGGIKRWATAVRKLQDQGDTVVVVNGGMTEGDGRQMAIKSETFAEVFRSVGVAAINITGADLQLGSEAIRIIERLSGGVVTSLEPGAGQFSDDHSPRQAGPFLICGVEDLKQEQIDEWIPPFIEEAKSKGKAPILLLFANESVAKNIANQFPSIAAIVYVSSNVMSTPIKVGQTWLLTPGEKGKFMVSATWDGAKFTRYRCVELGPEFADDPKVSEIYNRYLERVGAEKILDMVPRTTNEEFAGSQACANCHDEAYQTWLKSKHAKALDTLEAEKHDRDPDCVSCHVVGLESSVGFMNRAETPHLAEVGCESCHGAGKAHSEDPKKKLGTAGPTSCVKCHVPDHSPKFDFPTYWEKIKH